MFKTFGTRSVFLMLMPSLREIPFSGLEWSFFVKSLADDREEEEEEDDVEASVGGSRKRVENAR